MALPFVTTQPLPFGLEREKHIDLLFRAFHRQVRPTDEMQDLSLVVQAADPVTGKTGEGANGGAGETEVDSEDKSLGKLAVLRTVTRLHITARPELQGPQCVARRTYSVSTETRDQLFVAVEESSCVCVQFCGPARSCSLQGFVKDSECVFLFERPLRAEVCWLGCCLMEMRAFTPERELIGTVYQRWSMFTPYFEVCDSEGISTVRIQGSYCNTRCLSEQELQVRTSPALLSSFYIYYNEDDPFCMYWGCKVVSSIGESIGRIWKRWPGYREECNMDHEYFGLDVPQGMSLKIKVLLLAATFLLNHMFFEMS